MVSTSSVSTLEYITIKVFLYKYTPPFSPGSLTGTGLSEIQSYSLPLDSAYFSKYDISNYVVSYTFDQDINQNTFNWSILLQNISIPASVLSQLQIFSPPTNPTNLELLAQSISQTEDLSDISLLETAISSRGNVPTVTPSGDSLTIKNQPPVPSGVLTALLAQVSSSASTTLGIKLSDLIQPYDFISLFLYKQNIPLATLTGSIKTDSYGYQRFVPAPSTVASNISAVFTGPALTTQNLQQETILLSPYPNQTSITTLFSNEFNGFVVNKSFASSTGNVDNLTISGRGITQLFGSTRRLVLSSLQQANLYTIAQTTDPVAFSAFGNRYVGMTPLGIIQDLLTNVYRINFSSNSGGYYDISTLVQNNITQTNAFVIPPYLLASTMSMRGFKTSTTGYLPPALLDSQVNTLTAYFKFLGNVFTDFNAELKTPFEIIDDVKSNTFLEFFELPNGQIVIRIPAYNGEATTPTLAVNGTPLSDGNFSNTIYSSNESSISTTYTETIDNQICRIFIGYGSDVLGQIPIFPGVAHTNGKLLAQYGFMESGSSINPNVRNTPTNVGNPTAPDVITTGLVPSGLFKYSEYFLTLHNAALKTGSVTLNLDPSITIGMTYYDTINNKFSYITHINKNVTVGGTTTMTLGLSYVRDAYVDKTGTLQFVKLLTLVDVETSFEPTETANLLSGTNLPASLQGTSLSTPVL